MNRPDATSRAAGLALAAALFAGLTSPAARADLVAVSPGERDRAVEATSACPTFSWSALPGAAGYELAVFRLDRGEEPELAWTRGVAGSATSWSPSRHDCLEAGGRYAWTVRAMGSDSPNQDDLGSEWAEPLRFLVPGVPSDEEVAAALATLERWRLARGTGSEGAGFDRSFGTTVAAEPRPVATPSPRRDATGAPGVGSQAGVATGIAAIRGENPDGSGNAFGVLGLSHSPAGAGLVARNESAGADLVLDGAANGETDTLLRQGSLDRPSANPESFDFRNSGSGILALTIDGVDVVTTATDQDTLGALSCPDGQISKRVSGTWQCAADADQLQQLPCTSGEIAKVDPGGNWVCAADDDSLAELSCPDGQIAKRVTGVWACAPDDTGSAGIWTSYSEGPDVRVYNAVGNRVGIGNRRMQPVGSFPSEDGALTVVHSATQPATTEYSLTMDGQGLQARSRPGIFDPQQDAPLLLNRYGGGVAIGKEAAPTRAALEAQGSVGNTMATFQRNAGGQGIALVGDWPGLYANAYFANGVQTMTGSGYSQLINFEQGDGAIAFQTSTAPNSAPDVPAGTIAERLRISKEGALLSSLTQNQFNLAPLAVISASYLLQSNGAGGLTVTTLKQLVRSAYPVNITVTTTSEVSVTLSAQVLAGGNGELIPVVGVSIAGWLATIATTALPVSADTFEVTAFDSTFSGRLVGQTWQVQVVVYGMN